MESISKIDFSYIFFVLFYIALNVNFFATFFTLSQYGSPFVTNMKLTPNTATIKWFFLEKLEENRNRQNIVMKFNRLINFLLKCMEEHRLCCIMKIAPYILNRNLLNSITIFCLLRFHSKYYDNSDNFCSTHRLGWNLVGWLIGWFL